MGAIQSRTGFRSRGHIIYIIIIVVDSDLIVILVYFILVRLVLVYHNDNGHEVILFCTMNSSLSEMVAIRVHLKRRGDQHIHLNEVLPIRIACARTATERFC